jgi:hypothetical protein
MAKPQMGKTGDRIVGNMKLREEYGVIDRDGKLIPFEQARNKVAREASKREMDEVEGIKFLRETMTKLGYGEYFKAHGGKACRGRKASGSAETQTR